MREVLLGDVNLRTLYKMTVVVMIGYWRREQFEYLGEQDTRGCLASSELIEDSSGGLCASLGGVLSSRHHRHPQLRQYVWSLEPERGRIEP